MRFASAIFLSMLAHGLLAALLALYVACAPGPDTLAQLDLSSVELSFADVEDESAAASPSVASAPAEPEPEMRPPEPPRPPEVEPPPKEIPPDPEAMKIPEPAPEPPPMETPPPPPEPDKKPELPKQEPDKPKTEERPKERPRPTVAASAPSPAAAPRQGRVDAPPSPRRNIKPDYPKGARQRGEHGDVTLEIVVSASGSVGDVRVASSSGYAELDEAAVKAVKSARFVPAKRGGRPVASPARITLTFRLK